MSMLVLLILPFIGLAILLLIVILIKTIVYIYRTRDYKILLLGFIVGVLEVAFMITTWVIGGSIDSLMTLFIPILWIISLSVLALILASFSNVVIRKISNILGISAFVFVLLIVSPLFEILLDSLNLQILY